MNVYKFELSANKKSNLIWLIALLFCVVFFMSTYTMITSDADAFKKMLEGMPLIIRQALGIAIDKITSPLGFYSYIFTYVLLLGAICATNLGINLISKEVRFKTADFLLSKPKTRFSIITTKLLSGLTSLIMMCAIFIVMSILVVNAFAGTNYNLNSLILISATLLFVQLIFYLIGFLVAVVFPKIKSAISVSLPLVFALFFLSIIESALGDQSLKALSVFKYFDTDYIIANNSYDSQYVGLSVAIILVCCLVSYIVYYKKDVHSV